MRFTKLNNNLFAPENVKYFEVNTVPSNPQRKNFINGLENARKLLEGLESSLSKTAKYEELLLRCKATHAHSHDWWDSESWDKSCVKSEKKEPSKEPHTISESWSTISIVCLQYQYEELAKKYSSLLQAYHESCNLKSTREASLARVHAHTRRAHAQLAHAHHTLITIAEKYLRLQRKKQIQKTKYEARIKQLNAVVRGLMAMCEHARLQLDTRIMRFMETEKQAPNAQLLAEIRKCNLLFLENLKLKAKIEELTPGIIFAETPSEAW